MRFSRLFLKSEPKTPQEIIEIFNSSIDLKKVGCLSVLAEELNGILVNSKNSLENELRYAIIRMNSATIYGFKAQQSRPTAFFIAEVNAIRRNIIIK